MAVSEEKAQEALNGFQNQAEEMLNEPSKVEEVLQKFEAVLKEVPEVGEGLARVPLMISMIRAYITKEYTVVSPKVVGTMLASVIYLLMGKDIIPDRIPIIGHIDDIAVIALALKLNEKELDEYAAWRK